MRWMGWNSLPVGHLFVANATAAIKLILEAFRDDGADSRIGGKVKKKGRGFWYGYHRDAHSSLVGVRQATNGMHRCFESDAEVEGWIQAAPTREEKERPCLFGYPGQSNMTGRRLPLSWPSMIRQSQRRQNRYTLLDAAALATSTSLDFGDEANAPDFTSVSFYKIFDYPDLGALIVRKSSGAILQRRRYFGGGTVDMVISIKDDWHAKKNSSLHDQLEDGTLPFHSIFALDAAIDVHQQLFGSMKDISAHTAFLSKRLYDGLSQLKYLTGTPLCHIYKDASAVYGDPATHGATVAFNVQEPDGTIVGYTTVERLADQSGIYLRSSGLCSPDGIATYLEWAPWEMKAAYAAGQRCSRPTEVMHGKPTGVVRASLGAMSTIRDVGALVTFLRKTFLADVVSSDAYVGGQIAALESDTSVADSLDLSDKGRSRAARAQGWNTQIRNLIRQHLAIRKAARAGA
ncbi:hypothetical protein LTS18_008252 [Coniosporium uncinatum]|uniref:Uncharacterized protein n=1 Tax=Coniosporium uncinatum TaxID=93489 RepID=A0ACC3DAK5_9PEZI|nr:hypothetical protein LTS18_008252 [Coniosporium uncinatum]